MRRGRGDLVLHVAIELGALGVGGVAGVDQPGEGYRAGQAGPRFSRNGPPRRRARRRPVRTRRFRRACPCRPLRTRRIRPRRGRDRPSPRAHRCRDRDRQGSIPEVGPTARRYGRRSRQTVDSRIFPFGSHIACPPAPINSHFPLPARAGRGWRASSKARCEPGEGHVPERTKPCPSPASLPRIKSRVARHPLPAPRGEGPWAFSFH